MNKRRKLILIIVSSILLLSILAISLILEDESRYTMQGTIVITQSGDLKTYWLIDDEACRTIMEPIDNDNLFSDLQTGDKIKVKAKSKIGNVGMSVFEYTVYVNGYKLLKNGSLKELKNSQLWIEILKKYTFQDDMVNNVIEK